MFNVILYQPEIPPNTGNIIRLCANTGAQLHLVRPLGFELDDRQLRRAGLDYHEYASLKVHDSLEECLISLPHVQGDDTTLDIETRLARFPHPNPDETTSHPTKQPKDGCQVVGYKPAVRGCCRLSGFTTTACPLRVRGQVAGYPPAGEGANVSLRELVDTRRVFAFTTKGAHPYHEVRYRDGDAFLFGPESRGLPGEVLASLKPEHLLRLPMLPDNRSLNLSNTVAIAVYEAWRQCAFAGSQPANSLPG